MKEINSNELYCEKLEGILLQKWVHNIRDLNNTLLDTSVILTFIFWLNESILGERHAFSHVLKGWKLFVITELESWINETLNLFRRLKFLCAINASHEIESPVSVS